MPDIFVCLRGKCEFALQDHFTCICRPVLSNPFTHRNLNPKLILVLLNRLRPEIDDLRWKTSRKGANLMHTQTGNRAQKSRTRVGFLKRNSQPLPPPNTHQCSLGKLNRSRESLK